MSFCPGPRLAMLRVLVLGSAFVFGPIGCRQQRPDVILITLDTTRADHLGVYGYAQGTSPQIDRFARESVVFRRAWSTDSWTLPSHASIFTGLYPTRHGAHANATGGDSSLGDVVDGGDNATIKVNRLSDRAVTLAEMLGGRGYRTAAFAGGPWLSPPFGLLQGYEEQDAWVHSLGGRSADELTDRAVFWMLRVPADQPLHLLVNYFDAHHPYDPPRGGDNLPDGPPGVTSDDILKGAELSPMDRAAYLALYDGEIRVMDHHFGRLLDVLRATGRYDGALIIVVGDHGETFGEHGLMGHGQWMYEDVLHVPLLVHFPGGRGGGTFVDTPVSVVDVLPLVAKVVGFAPPPNDGVSIGQRSVVLAESFRDALMIKLYGERFDRDQIAAIRWPWKLILPDRGGAELYRLDEDPEELRNLIGTEASAEREVREAALRVRQTLTPPPSEAPGPVAPRTRDALRGLGYVE